MGGTGRKVVTVGAGLIALYLVVFYYTGASKDVSAASTGGTSLIKAFQGR